MNVKQPQLVYNDVDYTDLSKFQNLDGLQSKFQYLLEKKIKGIEEAERLLQAAKNNKHLLKRITVHIATENSKREDVLPFVKESTNDKEIEKLLNLILPL